VEDLRGGGDETVILLQGKNLDVVELLHGTQTNCSTAE